MSQFTYGHATEEGFLALLDALSKGEWGAVVVPDVLTPQDLVSLGVAALCKVQLLWALLGMRRILNPRAEDAVALFDEEWDRVQRQLHLDVSSLENAKDAQTRADGEALRAAMLKGRGVAQTTLRYGSEVQWGLAQVQKADEPALQEIIARHALQERMDEVEATTRALGEAIGWDAVADERLRPSSQRRVALSRGAEACALVHRQLMNVLAHIPSTSAQAQHLNALLAPLLRLQVKPPPAPPKPAAVPTPDSAE
jgi:hypothetical protein